MGRSRVVDPVGIEELRNRIEVWRAMKASPVERMPEGLWGEAAALAGRLGISVVSRALGVGYAGLRQRLDESEALHSEVSAQGADFLDLGAWSGLGAAGCGQIRVVVERVDGSRLRLDVTEGAAHEVVDLLRAFMVQAVCSH
jgi:hypothetical protein